MRRFWSCVTTWSSKSDQTSEYSGKQQSPGSNSAWNPYTSSQPIARHITMNVAWCHIIANNTLNIFAEKDSDSLCPFIRNIDLDVLIDIDSPPGSTMVSIVSCEAIQNAQRVIKAKLSA